MEKNLPFSVVALLTVWSLTPADLTSHRGASNRRANGEVAFDDPQIATFFDSFLFHRRY